jgi:predicted transglutaminase-like cysteine proteinase
MSKPHPARRTTALYAIGLGLGLLACLGNAQAGIFEAAPYEISTIRLATVAPVKTLQAAPDVRLAEPFGRAISTLVKGDVQQKWNFVKRRLPGERRILARCRAHGGACPPAAKRFLAILDRAQTQQGWGRIAEINRAINLNIKPVDDMTQYGVVDLWATPLMAFASNAGDCEDYAIAKYVALREIGISEADLRLIVVRDLTLNQDHAVAAVRYDGRWLILDNRALEMRQDASIKDFEPLFVIDGEGAKRMLPRRAQPQDLQTGVAPVAANTPSASGYRTLPLLL